MSSVLASFEGSLEVISKFNGTYTVPGADAMPFNCSSDDILTISGVGTGTLQGQGTYFGQIIINPSTTIQLNLRDLPNIPTIPGVSGPPSNFFQLLSFSLVLAIVIRLVPNADGSPGASGIRIGGLDVSGTGNYEWNGWLPSEAYEDVDKSGTPYNKSSPIGRPVTSHSHTLNIENLDVANKATAWVLIQGQ